MAKERGLGKGLNALLGDMPLPDRENGESLEVPISHVEPGIHQPRTEFDQDALDCLTKSIQENGIIQPLTVRQLDSGYYQIIAGERRWRAAKQAGLEHVPVIVIKADDRQAMELGLIENLQRENLNPVEEANGYLTLKEEFGLTQDEIAERVGKSRSAVANSMRILSLSPAVLKMVRNGKLSEGHGRALLTLNRATQQKKVADQVVEKGLNVRQTEELARKTKGYKKECKKKPAADPQTVYLKEIEKELSDRWGRRVTLLIGRNKGKVQLEYYNNQDLEQLLTQLGFISN